MLTTPAKTKLKATWIKDLDGFAGAASLYKLSHTLQEYHYVIVSSVIVSFFGAETYIFGAKENGDIADWMELDGSFKGSLDHKKALKNAGYELSDTIVEGKQKQLK